MLLVALLSCLLLVGWLSRRARSDRAGLGLRNEVIVAADDSSNPTPTLYSTRYRLVGRPDQLVRAGRILIPVEHKPRARRLQDSHILQVAAQCLLVEDVYGIRPTHGLVIVGGGQPERVDFTPDLERRVLATMADMRSYLREGVEPGPQWIAPKCGSCSYREECWGVEKAS